MLAKDIHAWTGLPVAPYIGTAFGEFEDEWELLGGARIRWLPRLSTTHIWDGENLHHLADWEWDGGYRTGIVIAQQDDEYYAGVSLGASL